MSEFQSEWGYGTTAAFQSGWCYCYIPRRESETVELAIQRFESEIDLTSFALDLPGGYLAWVINKPGGISNVNACRIRQTVAASLVPIGDPLSKRIDTYAPALAAASRSWNAAYSTPVSIYVDADKNPTVISMAGGLESFASDGGSIYAGIPKSAQFDKTTTLRSAKSAGGNVIGTCMKFVNGDVVFEEAEITGSSSSSSMDVNDRMVFFLADTGIFGTTIKFESVSPTDITESSRMICQTADMRTPYFWFGSESQSNWSIFDEPTSTKRLGRSSVMAEYSRAVQFDQMNGNAYFLTAFRKSTEKGGPYGKIDKYEYSTGTTSEFVLSVGGIPTNIVYALDMKIDAARRRMWILDAGNLRVLRVNLDSGNVDRVYASDELLAPCSMTIDMTTGMAYIRSMNGTQQDGLNESSSSSQGSEGMNSRETIYVADETGMTAVLSIDSTVAYASSFIAPTTEDLDAMFDAGIPIPLPSSDSMKFDHLRRKIWWLSKMEETVVFEADVVDSTFRSLSLSDSLDSALSVTIDRDTGKAYVTGSLSGNGRITEVNAACSKTYALLSHDGSGEIRNLIVAGNELDNVMPFYCAAVAGPGNEEESSSSSQSDGKVAVETIDNSLLAEQATTSFTTAIPQVEIVIWGRDALGTLSTKTWSTKNGESHQEAADKASTTPLFSWSHETFSGNPVIVAIDGAGNLLKVEYDQEAKTASVIDECAGVASLGTGISTKNGDSNVYVSGDGSITRVNIDPTSSPGVVPCPEATPGTTVLRDSIVVGDATGDAGIGGLSVQFHDKSGTIWAISDQEGTLTSFSNAMPSAITTTYGPFPMPIKAVWSDFHSGVMVACQRSMSFVAIPSGAKTVIYGTPGYEVSDVCIKDGVLGISMVSEGMSDGLFKMLDTDMKTNMTLYRTTNEFPSKACFSETGKAVVAVERSVDGVQKTRFVYVAAGEAPGTSNGDTDGTVVNMFLDENFGLVFAVFSSGDIAIVSQDESGTSTAAIVGTIPGGVVAAGGSLISWISAVTPVQQRVRVFVGSSEGANDRWDSGEVETSVQEMLYGGGDNLSPGEAYWMSISVMDEAGGWSQPATRKFVVPIM